MEEIENEIFRLRENGKADARHYSVMKTIEAEQAQLSPAYLQKLAIEAMTNNTKLYFGNSIPSFLSENFGEINKSLSTMLYEPAKNQ